MRIVVSSVSKPGFAHVSLRGVKRPGGPVPTQCNRLIHDIETWDVITGGGDGFTGYTPLWIQSFCVDCLIDLVAAGYTTLLGEP